MAEPNQEGQQQGKTSLGKMLAVAAASAGAVFLFMTPTGQEMLGIGGGEAPTKTHTAPKKMSTAFLQVPDILVNLSIPPGSRQRFLKLSLMLELANEHDKTYVKSCLPKIVDAFHVYLRELRVNDLQGMTGIYRLREALITRANAESSPVNIQDVLFRDMLVQ